MLTDNALRRIVARATTLAERLARQPTTADCPDEDIISSRLERWSDRAAHGHPGKLVSRLGWDGHDATSVRATLSDSVPVIPSLPGWAVTIREFVGRASAATSFPDRAGGEAAFPFEDVFHPFVEHALGRLARPIPTKVRRALAGDLLARLTRIAGPTLWSVFSERRPCGHTLLAQLADELGLGSEDKLYRAFVSDLRNGGLGPLFERYPVLARLLGTAFDLWIEEIEEFFRRLDADSSTLAHVFQDGRPLGDIVEIESSLSDPHNGSRMVRCVTFDSGIRLVYKPRNLGIEQAWNELVAWVNERGDLLDLWAPRLVEREQYGWVEFVAEASCADEEAVRRFYRRAGMLVCLTYVFQGNDFHRENLLARGEHPALIDIESILNGEIRLGTNTGKLLSAHQQMIRSVTSSGLLPRWTPAENGKAYDMSGLGSEGEVI